MRKSTFEKGDAVEYFAEGNAPEEPFIGPFPGRVTNVHEPTKPEPGAALEQRLDLVVRFAADGDREHVKSSVLVVAEPRKHCCVPMREGRSYAGWFDEAAAESEARTKAEAEAREKQEYEELIARLQAESAAEDVAGDEPEVAT